MIRSSLRLPDETRTIVVARDLWEAIARAVPAEPMPEPAVDATALFGANVGQLEIRVDDALPKGGLLALDAAGNVLRLRPPLHVYPGGRS